MRELSHNGSKLNHNVTFSLLKAITVVHLYQVLRNSCQVGMDLRISCFQLAHFSYDDCENIEYALYFIISINNGNLYVSLSLSLSFSFSISFSHWLSSSPSPYPPSLSIYISVSLSPAPVSPVSVCASLPIHTCESKPYLMQPSFWGIDGEEFQRSIYQCTYLIDTCLKRQRGTC